MFVPQRMKFGSFLAPFHQLGENPTLALQRDLELIQLLDRLDYDEAWIGEHHSAAWEIIGSPELFMAHALAQTSRIRLGTGVISLPYHNPFMVAERTVLLDHLSRGRAMLGVGPGALQSDAFLLHLESTTQRPRMDESLGIILRLLNGEEVTHTSDWIDLREARLQLLPYSDPCFPIAVASTLSPAGPNIAGKYGLGMISLAASTRPEDSIARQWEIAEEAAAKHGQTVHRRDWRLVITIHLAETHEQAVHETSLNAHRFQREYFTRTLGRPFEFSGPPERFAEELNLRGGAIIGTPDEAVAAIRRLQELSGGFGGLLAVAQEWAPTATVHRSFELFARYVAPHFQGSLAPLAASQRWAEGRRDVLNANAAGGLTSAFRAANRPVPEVIYGLKTSFDEREAAVDG